MGPMEAPVAHVDREFISRVYPIISPYVRRTPLVRAEGGDFGLPGLRLAFKLESMQAPGSFKVRGAFANLLTRDIPKSGVAAASGGNHGAAVAYAAMRLGYTARIFVPRVSSAPKVERIRRYGAQLVIEGERYADTIEACSAYAASTGAMTVHAYDSAETLAGAGTTALELENQLPEVDTVLVPVGGGGLIGGIA